LIFCAEAAGTRIKHNKDARARRFRLQTIIPPPNCKQAKQLKY
jgi:hypothetical protein